MKTARYLSIASVALIAFPLAACGQQPATVSTADSSQSSNDDKLPQSEGPVVQREGWPVGAPADGLMKGMRLPLEQYMLSYADEMLIQQARDTVEIACMNRVGFPSWKTEVIGANPPESDNASNMLRRYGLSDPSGAAKYGYQLPPKSPSGATDTKQETPEASIALTGESSSGEAKETLRGKSLPEGGCIGEIEREVGNSNSNLVEDLSLQSFEESQREPEVVAKMSEWSTCMQQKGYKVANVWDASNLADPASSDPAVNEKELATAEIDCKVKSGLIGTWFAAETEIQKRLIEENQSALNQARSSNMAAQRQAQAEVSAAS